MNAELKTLMDHIGVSGLMRLAPLSSLKIQDLKVDDLALIADVLKLNITVDDELLQSATALLKGEGIDKAADLIKSPETVKRLVVALSPKSEGPPLTRVLQCPHCRDFFFENPP